MLVDSDGSVRVADFGLSTAIAKARADEDTDVGLRRQYSISHAAPELIEGKALSEDNCGALRVRSKTRESDVYAFGMVLYHVRDHRPPYLASHQTFYRFFPERCLGRALTIWPLCSASAAGDALSVLQMCPHSPTRTGASAWIVGSMSRGNVRLPGCLSHACASSTNDVHNSGMGCQYFALISASLSSTMTACITISRVITVSLA